MLWDFIESETTGLIQIVQVTGPSAQLLLQIIEGVSFSVLETIPAPRLQDVVYHLDYLGSIMIIIWIYLVVSNIYAVVHPQQ